MVLNKMNVNIYLINGQGLSLVGHNNKNKDTIWIKFTRGANLPLLNGLVYFYKSPVNTKEQKKEAYQSPDLGRIRVTSITLHVILAKVVPLPKQKLMFLNSKLFLNLWKPCSLNLSQILTYLNDKKAAMCFAQIRKNTEFSNMI